jgi:hypothetical protein
MRHPFGRLGPRSWSESLEELILALDCSEERFWGNWVERSLAQLRDSGRASHLLSAYGGMGSFSHLCIHPQNRYPITADEVEAVNDRIFGVQ